MQQRAVFQQDGLRLWDRIVLPVQRQVWTIALVATLGILAVTAWSRLQEPQFRASSMILAEAGVDVAALRDGLLARGPLTDLALRHGLARDAGDGAALVDLRRALRIEAAPGGVLVSVRWPDAEMAARLANDLAQQILDRPEAGLDPGLQRDLAFYRRDEARLWQEIAALSAEVESLAEGGTTGSPIDRARRTLALLTDQYEVLRRGLAEREVEARRQAAAGAGRFSLLQRARAVDARPVLGDWVLAGVAGSMLLAVAAAFVLERRFPGAPRPHYAAAPQRPGWAARLYRMFDDPSRPILGLPRYLVISVLIVSWLVALALVLGRS